MRLELPYRHKTAEIAGGKFRVRRGDCRPGFRHTPNLGIKSKVYAQNSRGERKAQVMRGWLQGVVQPMMFSLQKEVGLYRHGAVVAVRQMMNSLAAIVIPPIVSWLPTAGAPPPALSSSGIPVGGVRADHPLHPPRRTIVDGAGTADLGLRRINIPNLTGDLPYREPSSK